MGVACEGLRLRILENSAHHELFAFGQLDYLLGDRKTRIRCNAHPFGFARVFVKKNDLCIYERPKLCNKSVIEVTLG